ncbi:MAG: hypothetical protein AAF488_04365 [Planctomycetota bacterium]
MSESIDRSANASELWSEVTEVLAGDLEHLSREIEGLVGIVSDGSTHLRSVFAEMHRVMVQAQRENAEINDGIADEFDQLAARAVQLLQFEDLARQLAEHARSRATFLSKVVASIGADERSDRETDAARLTSVKAILEKERQRFGSLHHLIGEEPTGGGVVLF